MTINKNDATSTLSVSSTATDEDLNLTPKGTGNVKITANGLKFPDNSVQTTAASASPATSTTLGTVYGLTDSTSNNNTFIGYESGLNMTSSNSNIAIGHSALRGGFTYINGTVAIGFEAHKTFAPIVASGPSTVIGYRAMSNVSTTFCGKNTAVGFQALLNGGYDNTAVGHNALTLATGSQNCAFGTDALSSSTTGNSNAAFGTQALIVATGEANTAFGAFAGNAVTTATGNTLIGSSVANSLTTGSQNIVIGFTAEPSSATVNNEITLGSASIGTLRCAVTTITAISDARDKKNITPLQAGIEFIKKLNPVNFIWNMRDGAKVDIADAGFIAQELKQAQIDTGITIPNLVFEGNPDKLEAGYGALLPVLVKAIQELNAKVEALESQLKEK